MGCAGPAARIGPGPGQGWPGQEPMGPGRANTLAAKANRSWIYVKSVGRVRDGSWSLG